MIKIGKNAAGKDRFMLTIMGTIIVLIVAWVVGKIFMPKNNAENIGSKIEGTWFTATDSGFKKLEIKSSGYFYFNEVLENGKSIMHKGVITDKIDDSLLLVSFSNDTLFCHKILTMDKREFTLKNKKDSAAIIFKKDN